MLEQCGLSRKEASVYLAVLELGETKMTEITKKVHVPRTTIYSLLDSLKNRGLISFYVKRKKKYFVAENPEKLLTILGEKESAIREAMPRLKAIYNISGSRPKIRLYEGKEGIKIILSDILDQKRHFLAITSIEDINQIAKHYFGEFIQQRILLNLKVKLLTNHSSQATELKKTDGKELRETRFLPEKYSFHTANYVYGNKVAILSLKKFPTGIIIEDPDIAETQRMYFEILWENASR